MDNVQNAFDVAADAATALEKLSGCADIPDELKAAIRDAIGQLDTITDMAATKYGAMA